MGSFNMTSTLSLQITLAVTSGADLVESLMSLAHPFGLRLSHGWLVRSILVRIHIIVNPPSPLY